MSAFQKASERHNREKSIQAAWIFAGKVLFALALVLTATFALVSTEFLVAAADHLSNADLPLILQ